MPKRSADTVHFENDGTCDFCFEEWPCRMQREGRPWIRTGGWHEWSTQEANRQREAEAEKTRIEIRERLEWVRQVKALVEMLELQIDVSEPEVREKDINEAFYVNHTLRAVERDSQIRVDAGVLFEILEELAEWRGLLLKNSQSGPEKKSDGDAEQESSTPQELDEMKKALEERMRTFDERDSALGGPGDVRSGAA